MAESVGEFAESNREFGRVLLARIEAQYGISIAPIFDRADITVAEARREIHAILIPEIERRIAAEKPHPEWPLSDQPVDFRAAVLGGVDNVIPNIAVTQHNLGVIRDKSGSGINDYVKGVANGLSLIHEGQTPEEIALEVIGSGLAAFTIAGITGLVKGLIAKEAFKVAVRSGIRAMGKAGVVVGAVAVIIIEVLLYLLIYNKKIFLGMVFNNTELDLLVNDWRKGTGGATGSDLYLATGSATAFMQTNMNELLDSPVIQIKKRSIFESGNPNNVIAGGIFAAEKNFGLFGTEGVMVFSPYQETSPRFALLFACPYIMDNGTNVEIETGKVTSAKDFYNRLFDSRSLDRSASSGIYKFRARVATKGGGEATGIAVLDQPDS